MARIAFAACRGGKGGGSDETGGSEKLQHAITHLRCQLLTYHPTHLPTPKHTINATTTHPPTTHNQQTPPQSKLTTYTTHPR